MNIAQAISRILSSGRRYHRSQMCVRIARSQMCVRIAGCVALVAVFTMPCLAFATVVRMETTLGAIDIELYDDQAPITVANFLRYAGRGDYTTYGIIHRSVPGFIVQGGGHTYIDLSSILGTTAYNYYQHIPEDPPIQNEFSPSRSNVRSTIAMAKQGGNPDSATSEWFFNLSDTNAANLDYQNGGFTVFGHVLDTGPGTGMHVVDAVAALPIFDGANKYPKYNPCDRDPITDLCRNPQPQYFLELPTINYNAAAYIENNPTTYLQLNNLVFVTRIPNVKSTKTQTGAWVTFTADADMVLNSAKTVDTATAQSYLAAFTPPQNSTVLFNVDMFTLSMTGVMGAAGRVVTLHDGATTRPPGSRYYAYGPTPGNPAPHWYDFTFDGETGAEIVSGKILLHFVDGKRGDDDFTANGSIAHTGMQAVVTTTTPSTNPTQSAAGCSIAATSAQTSRSGDWILVSLFLIVVAIFRRRNIHDRICDSSKH